MVNAVFLASYFGISIERVKMQTGAEMIEQIVHRQ
jgi:hypothetical protein